MGSQRDDKHMQVRQHKHMALSLDMHTVQPPTCPQCPMHVWPRCRHCYSHRRPAHSSMLRRDAKPNCTAYIPTCRPSWGLAGVVGVIVTGLALLVEGEADYDGLGFSLVMTASCLSGLRFTLTQVLLHGHGHTNTGEERVPSRDLTAWQGVKACCE